MNLKVKSLVSRGLTALIVCFVVTLGGCAQNESASATRAEKFDPGAAAVHGEVVGVGASSQGSAQEGWIAGFQDRFPNVTVNYDPAGSGAGLEAFQQGAATFAGSDRPFSVTEVGRGPFLACTPGSDLVEFPAYISPIALVFTIDGVTDLRLDANTVAQIFSGKITRWDDPHLVALNPAADLPSVPITAVHRSDNSGTTANFTEYLTVAAPKFWPAGAVEGWPAELGGEGAQGSSGVIEAVAGGVGTIGYVDASRARNLTVASLQVGDEFVRHSPEAAANLVANSPTESGRSATDTVISIRRDSTDSDTYPLVQVSYLVGCQSYREAQQAQLVREYFSYVVSQEGQTRGQAAAGSAQLTPQMQENLLQSIATIGSTEEGE